MSLRQPHPATTHLKYVRCCSFLANSKRGTLQPKVNEALSSEEEKHSLGISEESTILDIFTDKIIYTKLYFIQQHSIEN
ncbi:hypothetical protein QTV06_004023 [Enterobacter ludwigii]|nr:hypothetical protein [Enterobacter ludwigii]